MKKPANKTATKKTTAAKSPAKSAAKAPAKAVKAVTPQKAAPKAKAPAKPVAAVKAAPKKAPAKKPAAAVKTAPKQAPVKAKAPAVAKASKETVKIVIGQAILPPPVIVKPKPKQLAPLGKPTKEDKHRFDKAALKEFKQGLLAKREELIGQMNVMRKNALERFDEENIEEDGTDSFSRLQTLEQAESQNHQILAIDEALRAIERGSYGVCLECGHLIRPQRLLALPFATICINCAQARESNNRPKRFI